MSEFTQQLFNLPNASKKKLQKPLKPLVVSPPSFSDDATFNIFTIPPDPIIQNQLSKTEEKLNPTESIFSFKKVKYDKPTSEQLKKPQEKNKEESLEEERKKGKSEREVKENDMLKTLIKRVELLEEQMKDILKNQEKLSLSLVREFSNIIHPLLGKITPLEFAQSEEAIQRIPVIKNLNESIYTGLYLKGLWEKSHYKTLSNPSFVLSDIPFLVLFPFSIEHTPLLAKLLSIFLDAGVVDYNAECKSLFMNLPLVQRAQYLVFMTIYGDMDSRLWKEMSKTHYRNYYMKLPRKEIPFPLDEKLDQWINTEIVLFEKDWKTYVFSYYKPSGKK